jgi:hypothetical protein
MAIVPSFIPGHESINGAINSFFGNDSIDVIRSIDYDVKYLWALRMVSGTPPKPFDGWFPAQDVTVPMAISESEIIEFAQSSIQVPIKTTGKEITVTFYDNDKRALLFWLADWINIDLQNAGKYMSGLADNHAIEAPRNPVASNIGNRVVPVRTIELTLLSKYKKIDKTIMYDVFPVGELPWSGDQGSEAQTYNMRFAIVREYEATSDNSTSFLDVAKDILGKFI